MEVADIVVPSLEAVDIAVPYSAYGAKMSPLLSVNLNLQTAILLAA